MGLISRIRGRKTALTNQADKPCVFCVRIANGEYDDRFANHVWFEPLNPVVPGHRLVVPVVHTANLNNGLLEADQIGWALRYFTNDLEGDYNIITSKGESATQTIQHLHFHIVPRHKDDGLTLPWTAQQELSQRLPRVKAKPGVQKNATRKEWQNHG